MEEVAAKVLFKEISKCFAGTYEEDRSILLRALQRSDHAIVLLDTDGHQITYASGGFLKIFGFSLVDIISKTCSDVLCGHDSSPEEIEALEMAIAKQMSFSIRLTCRRKHGPSCPVLAYFTPFKKHAHHHSSLLLAIFTELNPGSHPSVHSDTTPACTGKFPSPEEHLFPSDNTWIQRGGRITEEIKPVITRSTSHSPDRSHIQPIIHMAGHHSTPSTRRRASITFGPDTEKICSEEVPAEGSGDGPIGRVSRSGSLASMSESTHSSSNSNSNHSNSNHSNSSSTHGRTSLDDVQESSPNRRHRHQSPHHRHHTHHHHHHHHHHPSQ